MHKYSGKTLKVKTKTDANGGFRCNGAFLNTFTAEMVEKVVKTQPENKTETQNFPIIPEGNYIVREDLKVGEFYGKLQFTQEHTNFLNQNYWTIKIKKIFPSDNFIVHGGSIRLLFSPEMLRPKIAGCSKLYGQTAKPLYNLKKESSYGTPDLEAGDKILIRKDLIFNNNQHYGEIVLSPPMEQFSGKTLTVAGKSLTVNAYYTKESSTWLWSPETIEKVIKGKPPYNTIFFQIQDNYLKESDFIEILKDDIREGDEILISDKLCVGNTYNNIIFSEGMSKWKDKKLFVENVSAPNHYITYSNLYTWTSDMIKSAKRLIKPFNPIAEYDPERTFKNEVTNENKIISKKVFTLTAFQYEKDKRRIEIESSFPKFELIGILETYLMKMKNGIIEKFNLSENDSEI